MQERLFTWLNFISRPFCLLEDVVIFSTKPTGFLAFVLILSTADCNVDTSEQVTAESLGVLEAVNPGLYREL